ncbi:putative PurR-regulated permease PerM [Nonomuraea fuscirosea]|uniref:Putative PurR-regulated permease PerM n=1 Tax=Nonomuraea fuscirosea TaxID=1291556 RepID=A0A2T0M240_9ACTN|nr:AI-2E family transporter [Nonomuraea fuscirosea]PRX50804.1 putative PurR-regulated permease PerM [Nonomuraea fuscirosea]
MTKPFEPRNPRKPRPEATQRVQVLFSPANVWRVGFVVVAVVVVVYLIRFVLTDAGSLIVVVVMAWFLSLAMEPAVGRLARHMRRGAAAVLVMIGIALLTAVFLFLFGNLFVEQAALLVRALPEVVTGAIEWINARFGTRYDISTILSSINLTPQQAATYAQDLLGGVLGLLGTITAAVFNAFALLLLTFYFSADGPRLRRWLAQLLPGRIQQVFLTVWDVSLVKTGGYVSARLILAAINGTTSAVVFLLIGLPSWLALAVWTGMVAQLVPTIGTYIAIALPTVVGLVSPQPWIGLAALAWGILYQQVENLTLEPRISGRAVNMHPGVAFAGVLLGAQLFGAVGALLAVPVLAMLLSLVDTFVSRKEMMPVMPDVPEAYLDEDGEEPATEPEPRTDQARAAPKDGGPRPAP